MAAVKQRAKLNASLLGVKEAPPAADLSSIRIVRRDKAPVVTLADSRTPTEAAKAPADGAFFKKGSATAATFRPTYWSYERRAVEESAPVPSLEEQIGARQHSSTPAADRDATEKPPASLYQPTANREPPALAPETIALLLSQTGSAVDEIDAGEAADIEALQIANATVLTAVTAEISSPPAIPSEAETTAPASSSPPDEAIGEESAPLVREQLPPAIALLLSTPASREAPTARADVVRFPIAQPRLEAPPIEAPLLPEAIEPPPAQPADTAPTTQSRDVAPTSAPPVSAASPTAVVDTPPQQLDAAAPLHASELEPPVTTAATPVVAATAAPPEEAPPTLKDRSAQPVDLEPAPPPLAVDAIPALAPAPRQELSSEQLALAAREAPQSEALPSVAPVSSNPSAPVDDRSAATRREKSSKTKSTAPQKTEDPTVTAFIRELGATIDAVLAARWYGSDQRGAHPIRAVNLSHELQAVTPSSLIAELAAVRRQEAVAQPPRSRRGGAILGFAVALMIAAAGFFGWSLWQAKTASSFRAPAYRSDVAPAVFGTAAVAQMQPARAENTKKRPAQP
jgi:hypothetical protein